MKWLSQFSLVIRSNINSLVERFEDPERMIHQLIIDMEEELARVQASVAGAMADEIQLDKQAAKASEEAGAWDQRATAAWKRGDETSAKGALEQKVLAQQRADRLRKEHGQQKEQTEKLHRAVRDLESKIRQARQKQTLLLARLTRAESGRRINQALEGVAGESAFAQFRKLEQRVERAEALEQAYSRLQDRDPQAEELERQFEEKERQEKLQREFEELKKRTSETP